MTSEERMELHEQWLRSMEDNHSRSAERLDRIERSLEQATERQDRTDRTVEQIAQLHLLLADEVRQLSSDIQQYIRSLKDGHGQN